MREDLKARRKLLTGRLNTLSDRLRTNETDRRHLSSQDHEGETTLAPLGRAGEAEMVSIREALRRMDQGQYGICVSCGEAIHTDRLDVLPFTPHCRICARSLE